MEDNGRNAAELVHAAQHDDRAAFALLYERYVGMVHAIALSQLRGSDVADVVQETFLRALRRLKSLRHASAFGPWLATIARNAARDIERDRWTVAEDIEAARPATQESELEASAVLRAIRALPNAYRRTVSLRVFQGMTGPEIAEKTGLTEGSVRVNLHRGMKLLRARLNRRWASRHRR